ncbi:MAG: SulP family inorganic anion transporter [Candidatus Promineifilaceae bacterium]|nr:SulP family inorganic anion transporter [Candidatus Promineifilaceae bacterium]
MAANKTEQYSTQNQKSLMTALSAGLVIGILVIFVVISFAALIFTGELAIFLSDGIGILLLGAFIIGITVAMFSTVPSAIALPQDAPAVIMAVVAAAIAAAMNGAAPEKTFATVLAAMMVSGVLTGICFWFLGRFNLGQLVRFIPYPVIGGFLAGTGWLLIVGAIGVMTPEPIGLAIFTPETLLRWLPGLLFGLVVYFLQRRSSHFLLLPALILVGVGLFYLVLIASGSSLTAAIESGWFLGPFPEGSLFRPTAVFAIREADWSVVAGQAVTISTIMLVSSISFLMNATGLEITLNRDFDLNKELRSSGISDILAGLVGCIPGYQSVSFTALGFRLGAKSRLAGLTSAVLIAIALLGGARLLALFPRVIVGGFLIFVGLSFLVEWLLDSYFTLSKLEYALIWIILIIIVTVGFLEGVIVGTVVAAIFFVLNYSRISIARHAFSGSDYQSHVLRPRSHQQLISVHGQCLQVMELQGYIFFGTAHRFLEQIRTRISDPDQPAIRFLLLDFRLVTGIDSSAILSLRRLLQTLEAHDIQLILTALAPEIEEQWSRHGLNQEELDHVHLFPELNRGVAWSEQMIINDVGEDSAAGAPQSLKEELQVILNGFAGGDDALEMKPAFAADRLDQYFTRIEVAQFHCLLREGDQVDGLYFVEEGQVMVKAISKDRGEIALRTMEKGSAFGEIGIYARVPATADVTASEPSVLIYLPAEQIKRMEREDPQLAAAFHHLNASLLAEKLTHTDRTVRALLF